MRDRDTGFFHAATKNRITRNTLTSIQDVNGMDVHGNRNIATEAIRYFTELFSTNSPTTISKALRNIHPVVTPTMNDQLLKDVSEDEIRDALFSIGGSRAPGPDGFNAVYYQTYWDIVGSSIVAEVKTFFNTGTMDKV